MWVQSRFRDHCRAVAIVLSEQLNAICIMVTQPPFHGTATHRETVIASPRADAHGQVVSRVWPHVSLLLSHSLSYLMPRRPTCLILRLIEAKPGHASCFEELSNPKLWACSLARLAKGEARHGAL